jgi:type IVB pilus formation R64 PilN family outer membrane protein
MRLSVLSIALVAALSGCSTTGGINAEHRASVERTGADTQRILESQPVRNPRQVSGAYVSDVPYVDPTPVSRMEGRPAALARQVAMNEPAGLPIQTLMHKLTQLPALANMRLTYDTDILEDQAGAQGGSPGATMPPATPNPQQALIVDSTLSALAGLGGGAPGTTVTNASSVQIGGAPATDLGTRVAIVYTGSAEGLLDQVAAGLGASWKYMPAENRIHFARYVTETFSVATVPGTASSEAKVGGQQQGAGGATNIQSTAESTNKVISELDIWKGIEDGVKQLLSSKGSVTINQTTTSVTVRDRADRVEAVRKYLEHTNDILTRRVDVEVRVYRVSNRKGDDRAFSLDMLVNQFSTNPAYRFQLFTPRPDASALASGVFQVPSRTDGNINRYGGSSVALDSLSSALEASEVTRQSVTTTNNMPAPVNIVRRTAYLASTTPLVGVGGSIGGNAVSAGASLTPGQVETGLNMQIIPSVQSDGQQVYMQIMLKLSTLDALRTISSGGQSIEVPEVSSREFLQRVWMNTGETLVLAGFEQYDTGSEKSGFFDASLWPLAGSRSRNTNKDSIVVTVTPVVSRVRTGI